MIKKFKKFLSVLLRVGVSVIILFFLFRQVDEKVLFEIIKGSNKWFLLLAFVIFSSGYILGILRWEMLLKAIKINLSLKRIVISSAGGVFFSLFLPSTIGGDLVRSVDLAAHTKRPREVIATVLLDRLSGYVGLVLLALLSLAVGWKLVPLKSVLPAVFIITSILIAGLLVLFNKFAYNKVNKLLTSPSAGKIRESIKNLHHEIHLFRQQKKVISKNLGVSFLIQLSSPLAFYVIALSLGIKISVIYFFVFLPIIGAITLLPISIGGLGLRDATTIFFFGTVGVSKDLAFAMSLVSFFFILVFAAVGGLIYVLTVHHRRIQHHQSSPVHAASR